MARLSARVGRLERTHEAVVRSSMPRRCTCCGGVDPATGTGPLHGCTHLGDLIICRGCPNAWRGNIEETPRGLMLVGGVPAETPY